LNEVLLSDKFVAQAKPPRPTAATIISPGSSGYPFCVIFMEQKDNSG